MKWIDIPPVWLIAHLAVAWWVGRRQPLVLSLDGTFVQFLSGLLIGGGVVLILAAVFIMRRHRTTIIPRQSADALVTTGVFKWSRNPIYLGDGFVLTGLILRWDAVLALPLVPLLVWIIEKRFILPEERALRRKFTAQFGRYFTSTRRWL